MKLFKKLAVLTSLLISFQSFAVIREALSMQEVAKFITPGTLVIFDLDNTVLEATQTLGTDQFFGFLVKKAVASGMDEKAAKELALKQSRSIQPVTRVRLVEKETREFIQDLQAQNYPVMALTARPPSWVTGTLKQVASLGINFAKTAPLVLTNNSDHTENGLYNHGVFFLPAGSEKGATLINFLNENGQRPERIIFIDDKLANVQSVDKALTAAGITNLEFRYGAADVRVKNFNPDLANFEYNYFLKFNMFLDDQMALWLMSHSSVAI